MPNQKIWVPNLGIFFCISILLGVRVNFTNFCWDCLLLLFSRLIREFPNSRGFQLQKINGELGGTTVLPFHGIFYKQFSAILQTKLRTKGSKIYTDKYKLFNRTSSRIVRVTAALNLISMLCLLNVLILWNQIYLNFFGIFVRAYLRQEGFYLTSFFCDNFFVKITLGIQIV